MRELAARNESTVSIAIVQEMATFEHQHFHLVSKIKEIKEKATRKEWKVWIGKKAQTLRGSLFGNKEQGKRV